MENVDSMDEAGCLPRWLVGGVLPLGFAILGIASIATGRSYLPGRWGGLTLTGIEAQLLGVCLVSIGLVFFARYTIARFVFLSTGLQVAALATLIGAAGTLIVRIVWY